MVLRKRRGLKPEKAAGKLVEKDPGGSTLRGKYIHKSNKHPHYPKTLIGILLFCFFVAFRLGLFMQKNVSEDFTGRRLEEVDMPSSSAVDCFPEKVEPWVVPFCILGVFYMFMGLSFVCDEFFVPALEVIADKWDLSNDVAGATLMAAGGSAPELFTSFIGTFRQSDIGFGTIVGSAVFNILFVIGVCGLAVEEPLQLTWWPLARDCVYYAMSLLILSVFFAVVSKSEIGWWEALILLLLYFVYVIFMKYNMVVKAYLFGKEARPSVFETIKREKEVVVFRIGLLNLLVQRSATLEKELATRLLVQVTGNMKETFDSIDTDNDGSINMDEFILILQKLSLEVDENDITKLFMEIGAGEENMSFEAFKK